jgi:hypothetical protein
MDGSNDLAQFSRIPTVEDLVVLCDSLNRYEVKYIIIGGFAIIHFGYIRATGDVDLLIDDSPDNIDRIRKALSYLPDGEVQEITDDDFDKYSVVRVCGDITIDLLSKACEVTYNNARDYISFDVINGIQIPYLKPELLIKTKLGIRPKDVQDHNFLQQLLKNRP